ncbi:hypothetical protein OG585_36110 [Streptomyces sp. NBC_01340]|uniref:hypothetical protein n=1 Tax=unclassified Streptomyces TaxID=2593676 RepID=UPI00225BD865|nr:MULTISPECIES: hypothetical protein [unclassified Streptomyces]MCX4457973.1 hypothetical protein [Streptomyces sp. NBC_01719]MCX4497330.1 hypothetical protein [Streptomyces sp. NBC_01728]WSI42176.1 hypothetical protein OG585_36110 [Streptomyces sp. NBC_01340]
MFVLLLILIVVLFGLGFLSPLWWVAAGVLVFGATRYGRGDGGGWIRGDGSDLGEYRDYENHRDRQDRWDRRYSLSIGRAGGARTVGTMNAAGDR